MKKNFSLSVLLLSALCGLIGFSCSDDDTKRPEPKLTFRIESTGATRSTVDIRVTPSDLDASYIYLMMTREEYEARESDEALVAADFARLEALAAQQSMTLGQLLEFTLVRGVREQTVAGLKAGQEYCLYVYGMDMEGRATSSVTAGFVATEAVEMADCVFTVETSSTRTKVSVAVSPSDGTLRYYYELLAPERFEALGGTPEAVAEAVVAEKISGWQALGSTVEEAVVNMSFAGDHDYTFTELKAGTDYHLFVCGIDRMGYICTEVGYRKTPTEPFALSENRIDLEVGGVTWDSAEVKVCVTENDPYLIAVKPAADLEGKSDEQIIESIVASYGAAVDNRTSKGAQTLLCDKNLQPDTDYTVVAFGYDGGATTGLFTAAFHTEKASSGSDGVTFSFSADGSEVTVEPSDPSALYVWGVVDEDEFQNTYGGDPSRLRQLVQDLIDLYVEFEIYASAAEYVAAEGCRGTMTDDTYLYEGSHRVYAVCMNEDGSFAADPVVWDQVLSF